MGVTLQGPLAGAVVAILGLYLLFGPIEELVRKPLPFERRKMSMQEVPTWMRVFFRGLGLALLVLSVLLLAPVFRGA